MGKRMPSMRSFGGEFVDMCKSLAFWLTISESTPPVKKYTMSSEREMFRGAFISQKRIISVTGTTQGGSRNMSRFRQGLTHAP